MTTSTSAIFANQWDSSAIIDPGSTASAVITWVTPAQGNGQPDRRAKIQNKWSPVQKPSPQDGGISPLLHHRISGGNSHHLPPDGPGTYSVHEQLMVRHREFHRCRSRTIPRRDSGTPRKPYASRYACRGHNQGKIYIVASPVWNSTHRGGKAVFTITRTQKLLSQTTTGFRCYGSKGWGPSDRR